MRLDLIVSSNVTMRAVRVSMPFLSRLKAQRMGTLKTPRTGDVEERDEG